MNSYPEPYLIAEGIHRPLENFDWLHLIVKSHNIMNFAS